jgi:hypothetical protein
LEDYAVTSPLPHLFGSFFPPDDIQRLDSCEYAERVGTRTAALLSAIPIKPLSRLEAGGEMLIASYFSTCVP